MSCIIWCTAWTEFKLSTPPPQIKNANKNNNERIRIAFTILSEKYIVLLEKLDSYFDNIFIFSIELRKMPFTQKPIFIIGHIIIIIGNIIPVRALKTVRFCTTLIYESQTAKHMISIPPPTAYRTLSATITWNERKVFHLNRQLKADECESGNQCFQLFTFIRSAILHHTLICTPRFEWEKKKTSSCIFTCIITTHAVNPHIRTDWSGKINGSDFE